MTLDDWAKKWHAEAGAKFDKLRGTAIEDLLSGKRSALTKCCELCPRDIASMFLLYHIAVRPPKPAIIQRGGKSWIAMTAQHWMPYAVLSYAQYKRALRILKSRGLVEVERHRTKWGGSAPVTHVRALVIIPA